MTINNFVPEIWSAATLESLQEEAVLGALVNREYEGEARRGNQVNITGVVVPTITDYAGAGRTTSAEDISDTGFSLLIDQEKAFDFHVDDVDRAQAAGSFERWTAAAGTALANDADAYIASRMFLRGTSLDTSIVDIYNGGTSGGDLSVGDAAHKVFVDAVKQLNKANMPSSNRVAVVNAEFEAALLDASSKLTSFDTSGDSSGLRQATIGSYLGFRVVRSNLLPVQSAPAAVLFWSRAVVYVSQINQTEAMRSHTKFADRIRGLHVYGADVIYNNDDERTDYRRGVLVYAEADS